MDPVWLLKDSPYFGLAVAIIVTIVALAVSTILSIRYLIPSSVQKAGGDADFTSLVNQQDEDAAGNEGDDELEGDDDDDAISYMYSDSKVDSGKASISPRYPDPVDYCEHIQGEFKRIKQTTAQKNIEKKLSASQMAEEKDIQRQQLAEIFKLMQSHEDKYGTQSLEEMQDQMKLYCV